MQVRGSDDQIAGLPVQECLWVELGCRCAPTVCLRVDSAGRSGVADVEQRELHADLAPAERPRWPVAEVHSALPDTEQQVLTNRVQVARVAGDLQLARHLGFC